MMDVYNPRGACLEAWARCGAGREASPALFILFIMRTLTMKGEGRMRQQHEVPEQFDDVKYIVYALYTRFKMSIEKIAENLHMSEEIVRKYIRDVEDEIRGG